MRPISQSSSHHHLRPRGKILFGYLALSSPRKNFFTLTATNVDAKVPATGCCWQRFYILPLTLAFVAWFRAWLGSRRGLDGGLAADKFAERLQHVCLLHRATTFSKVILRSRQRLFFEGDIFPEKSGCTHQFSQTNWKGIAKDVQSRTHVQCRQRWKKVLTPGLVKGRWTADEDQLLASVVNKGDKNWSNLSAQIPGRTSKQVLCVRGRMLRC